MIVSHNWLQTYFKDTLPKPEDLAETLTMGVFEVEKIEQKNGDYTLDIDVLPNRAHDCLSHRGIAREIGILLNIPITIKNEDETARTKATLSVDVQEQTLCRRYIGTVIKNIKIESSPDWLKERLESIGQKSINNIVDATNFIMFDIGQPLHAFDLDKLEGGIVVRKASDDEKITTLGGDDVALKENDLVIADKNSLLAIAGVKGGTKAVVDDNTTNIVLESANFNPVSTRKTSRRLNMPTDSSKRFENELTPELAGQAMEELVSLIVKIAGSNETITEENIDIYPRPIISQYKIGISTDEINKVLGVTFSDTEIENILDKFVSVGFSWEKVTPRQKVLDMVESVLGSKYKRPSAMQYDAPNAFSCTSLISFMFVEAGIYMPSMAVDKYVFGTNVSKEELKPGDVIFVNTGEGTDGKAPKIYHETIEWMPGTKVSEGVDHAGIYLGDGKVLHTTWKFGEAVIEDIDSAKQFKNIIGYRSFIGDEKERYVVAIPSERLDLRIKEDLIEEIARVYGYTNIKSELSEINTKPLVNKSFYYTNKIRSILVGEGFSEVYNCTFAKNGEVELANPLSKGKEFLRTNLADGLLGNLLFNEKNAPLLGLDTIRIFEFGNVFKDDDESTHIAIGIRNTKKEKIKEVEKLSQIQDLFSRELGVDAVGDITENKEGGVILELDFMKLIETLPQTENYADVLSGDSKNIAYKTYSQYPYILRDIAVWIPEDAEEEDVLKIITQNSGDLLVRTKLFDRFEKPARTGKAGGEGRVSYAFNLVFQSNERTLTDEEVNKIMNTITEAMQNNNWEVR